MRLNIALDLSEFPHTHLWLPYILPMRRLGPPRCTGAPVHLAILSMSITSSVQHLRHSVPIAASGVGGRLVEIRGLSTVSLQFPQCSSVKVTVDITLLTMPHGVFRLKIRDHFQIVL